MEIRKIGIIGSGQIGPDIALYFTKIGLPRGIRVVVHDIVPAALDAGREKLSRKVEKGVESGAFSREQAEAMKSNVTWSADRTALEGCDLVVEAATERVEIKQEIFEQLEEICPKTAILASNSSHLEPERIFERVQRPGRCLVNHFFYPAERNPIVEIVPGAKTDAAVVDGCLRWYESIGKVPVRVKSRYGYAVDPVFEGIFLAAALCVEEGLGTPKQVDAMARRALHLGVGPFTAMNLTGGNPITQIGLRGYHEKIMPWFRSPKILDEQVESGKPWEVAARGEEVEYPEEAYAEVARRLQGAYFGLACEILEAGLVDPGDLEMAVELALVVRPPLRWMNEVGGARLVREYAAAYPDFRVPSNIDTRWQVPFVRRRDRDDVAVIVIQRPRTLNALNAEVIEQIDRELQAVKADPSKKGAVITGFGIKAFVSGADIDMLAKAGSAEGAVRLSRMFQDVLIRLENLGKPVVAALNGLAFGGGNELAMACTARVAKPGMRTLAAQPEVKLGIIPGAGATQRLPRWIPFERAWEMLRTGRPVSSEEALELGLVQKLADEPVEAAVELVREIAAGTVQVKGIPRGPIEVPENLPDVDLQGLSRRIDEILRKAVLEGARLPLEEGLALETSLWAEVFRTEDARIGLENFKKTGLKTPAPFVHR